MGNCNVKVSPPYGDFHDEPKELPRPGLIKTLLTGRITNQQAAAALHESVRQVQRLKRRFEAAGAATHGAPRRPPARPLVRRAPPAPMHSRTP